MHANGSSKELSTLIGRVEQAVRTASTVATTMVRVREGLAALTGERGFLERETGFPIAGDFTPRLLYRHPVLDVTVVASVLAPEEQTGVHDHGDTWAAYGVYRGAVRMIRWQRVDDGSRPERAELLQDAEFDLKEGETAAFRPEVVHQVRNISPEPSVALIVYGRDFAKTWRNVYDLGTGAVKRICWGPPPMPPRGEGAGHTAGGAAPVLWPAQHAEYRADTMGRSTLFATPNVRVGLNAFEPGQEHALHTHGDRDKVHYVLEGQGQFLLDGTATEIEPGMMMSAPIGTPHGIRNPGQTRLLVLTVLAPGESA